MNDALGVGLAATQVGVLNRVLVYRVHQQAPFAALVNPEIEWSGHEEETMEEGCLSLPNVHVDVERKINIRVQALNEDGEPITIEASGLEARVIQHEVDHLDGVLVLDRISRQQRKEAMRALREAQEAAVARRPRAAVRTVYLGTSDFAAGVLRALADTAHRPALVVTRPDRPRGRGRRLASPPVADAARELGIELDQPEDVNSDAARARIAAAAPETVCVCAFGALIKEPLLSEHPMLNVHPSLLPRWRGAAPIERAIMAGDEVTGVSIMRVTAGLDSGPVCAAGPGADRCRPTPTAPWPSA